MVRKDSFFQKKYPVLHKTQDVISEDLRRERAEQETSDTMEGKVDNWLQLLERTHRRHDDHRVLDRIKTFYHKEHVIKDQDIPNSFLRFEQKRILGIDNLELEFSQYELDAIKLCVSKAQEDSLDKWVDNLTSEEADHYPMWAKYWSFQSITRMSKFNMKDSTFGNRSKGTVTPFPEFNAEALALTIDLVIQHNDGEVKDFEKNEDLTKFIEGLNFKKIYGYYFNEVTKAARENTNKEKVVLGEWLKFDKHNLKDFIKSLDGQGTGWCVAAESVAADYIKTEGEGFIVFYSNDSNDEPRTPRIALHHNAKGEIEEIRGVGQDQNLEFKLLDVLDEKLTEYVVNDDDLNALSDLKIFKSLDNKEILSIDDLEFLYETKRDINFLGMKGDSHLQNLLKGRNRKHDFAQIFDIKINEVSDSVDLITEQTKIYSGEDLITLEGDYDLHILDVLSKTRNVDADLTNLDSSIKDKILNWEGDILDDGETVSYSNLEFVKKFDLPNAITCNLNSLYEVVDFSMDTALQVLLPRLIKAGWLDFADAKHLDFPVLESISFDFRAYDVEILNAPNLKEVGHSFYAPKSTSVNLGSLDLIGGDLELGSDINL